MCLGLSGLSFLTMPCFELLLPFSTLSLGLSSDAVGLLEEEILPLLRRPAMLLLVLKPLTLGAKPTGRFGVELISPLSLLIGITLSAELGVLILLLLFRTPLASLFVF